MNQNSNSIKTIIIIVLLVIVGYFIYANYANRQAAQDGSVRGHGITNVIMPAGTSK